jgi:hypothetical protein
MAPGGVVHNIGVGGKIGPPNDCEPRIPLKEFEEEGVGGDISGAEGMVF